MKSFFSGLSLALFLTLLLVGFQNCGVSPRQPESSLDDRVHKIARATSDDTDDSLILNGLHARLKEELGGLSPSQPQAELDVQNWLESSYNCKTSLGVDRQSCFLGLIQDYFHLLKHHFSYSLFESANCTMGRRLQAGGAAALDVTCMYDPAEVGQYFLHTGLCEPQPEGGFSAIAPFDRSRHYQRLFTTVHQIPNAPREISVLVQDALGDPFTDVCGNLHSVREEDLTFLF